MAAGRPTKYNKAIVDRASEYLSNYQEEGDLIPSIAGLACVLEIPRQTLHRWSGEEGKEDFRYILEKIQAKQESVLINKGLSGEFNAAITKLALGKHGYSDKQETDVTSGGKPVKNEWHVHPVTTQANGED